MADISDISAEKNSRRQSGGRPNQLLPNPTSSLLALVNDSDLSGISPSLDIGDTLEPNVQDRDDSQTNILRTDSDLKGCDVIFDTSKPRVMLRKPISKQLLTHNNKRSRHGTPLKTRKCIISHLNNKKYHQLLQKYAEEHKQNMNAQKNINRTKLELLTEKHRLFIDQQKELHQIDIEHKNQIYELTITKLQLEKENLKNKRF